MIKIFIKVGTRTYPIFTPNQGILKVIIFKYNKHLKCDAYGYKRLGNFELAHNLRQLDLGRYLVNYRKKWKHKEVKQLAQGPTGLPSWLGGKESMQETWVQSLGREDPLEKEMATHSNEKIPWTEESDTT